MITIGVDFHKRTSSYYVMDEQGQKLASCKLENTRENIRNFVDQFPGPKQLAMEATRNWGLYHECVEDLVDAFYLGHPKKMKAITESETKNDKNDAQMICRLKHSNFFPQAHVSSLETRELRSLLRFRWFLVQQRKSIRNQVQTLLDRNLWPNDRPRNFKSPFCHRGLLWMENLTLSQRERFILDQCLREFHSLTLRIDQLENFIKEQNMDLANLIYLRSVPGFRYSQVNIYIVLLETDTIERFHKARGFVHYAGLIPREHSSAEKHRTGKLVKDSNQFLRAAFIESALAAIRADRGLAQYYREVKERSGSSDAIVATARKLALAVYHVLKEKRSYRPFLFHPPAAARIACAVPSLAG